MQNLLKKMKGEIVMPKLAEQFINSIPNDLQEKLADFLLTIDKRGLDEILAGSSDEQVITKLWDMLNLFNPNGTDNDPTFTSDEWDEICTEMAWITEDLEGSCDICGDKGQVTEKLDTYSMNYYNHCSKKECIEYKDKESK